jgi:V-type H+-transporting ATPase subunit a
MSFAICLNVYNHVYYGKKAFVWLEFVPQILFMESVFGYLIFCIMYKWSVNWWELDSQGHHIHNAPPNLLNMLIYMFLTPGKVEPQDQLYPGQGTVQLVLILVALVCVPWMWFAKPYYMKKQHEQHQYHAIDSDEAIHASGSNSSDTAINDDDEKEEEEVCIYIPVDMLHRLYSSHLS